MNDIEIPCQVANIINDHDLGPMPPIGTDLSNVFLSFEQRLWLARQVLSGARKPAELVRDWNLGRHRVWKFARKVSENKIPGESRGRPRALDSAAVTHLITRVVSDGIRDSEILNAEHDLVYKDTKIRRRRQAFDEHFDSEDVLIMKKRTRRKYIASILGTA